MPGKISDGYHTFDELYAHRSVLMASLMASHPFLSWYSLRHHDDTTQPGYFIVGMNLPTGQISYHLRLDPWLPIIRGMRAVKEYEKAPEWDGHTSDMVVARIAAWISGKG
jgi:hypothetical protein